MLLFHIVIALSSMAYSTYAFVRPSKPHLYTGYGLVALTLTTGTILTVQTHARILQTCLTGLAYLGFVGLALAAAQYKLVRVKNS